jgi:nucleoside transporter
MTFGLRIRLSAMMFLEFFVWGAWVTVLSDHLKAIELDSRTTTIYGLLGLASIFMPILAGQVTDRMVATQKFLGVAHIVGGGGLILAAVTANYTMIFIGMLVWSLAFAPTISLTNSLAFSHMKDPEKDYSLIRTFGTIGWIASNWVLGQWRSIESLKIGGNDCLYLAAAAAIAMGLFCFNLPNTPPAKTGVSPFAFAKAFGLLKNMRVTVFLLVSFVAGTILWFYFPVVGPFLGDLGTSAENSPRIQSLGQVFEILTMLALPWFLKYMGPRKVLMLGMVAFALRNLIFMIGAPFWLVAASCSLHGASFVFFFVVGFIFIDAVAPKDIKGSAQGLLSMVVFGFGVWLGNMFSGEVKGWATTGNAVNWSKYFAVPLALSVLCAVVFLLTFPKGSMKEAAGGAPAPAEPAPAPAPAAPGGPDATAS